MGFFDKNSLSRTDLGPWFTTRFGECAECYAELEGEQARYKDGEVVCSECGDSDAAVKSPAKRAICTKCFVELSNDEQRSGLTTHREC